MEDNFDQIITELQSPSPRENILDEIKDILKRQESEPSSAFISQFYPSILKLEQWAWQLLSQSSHEWTTKQNYTELFRTIASFNKNLIFNCEDVETVVKSSLIIPNPDNCVRTIFDKLANLNDENDPLINMVSPFFDNLASLLQEYPEFESVSTIIYITRYMAHHYIMTKQYKSYLIELRQSPISESKFTSKMLFYLKTCSYVLSAYLFSKYQNFVYTPEEIIRHLGVDYGQIIVLHCQTIELWSEPLLSCIVHVMRLFSCTCWWGAERGIRGRLIFSTESSACDYITALITIINFKPLHQSLVVRQFTDEKMLLETALFSIANVAKNQTFLWFLRSKTSLPELLLSMANICIHDKSSLCLYGILTEILDDQSLKSLKVSDSASLCFFNMLEHAWRDPAKRYKQIPVDFLLKSFLSLAKIDAIQQKTADTNKVLLLIEMCDEYPIVYDILWALSFNHDIQEQLRSNTSFMSKLAHLPKTCDDQQVRKIAYGLLWNLDINHASHKSQDMFNEGKFDIMISYSHKDEVICRQIYEELVNTGYHVWIDFDQMHGNVMDAMAQAIENSKAVIICMSEEYRKSNYCRAEATYAFQRQIRIVPLIVQPNYRPDSWLLFLIGQLLYIDFPKNKFSQSMELLLKELKISQKSDICLTNTCENKETTEILPSLPVPLPSPSSLNLPINALDWNQTHVDHWLVSNGLLQMSRLLAEYDGRSLVYLYEIFENVEHQQVITLLQDDSLRRTTQNLSLVELARLRALLDREKSSWTPIRKAKSSKTNSNILPRKSLHICNIL